LVPLTKDIDTKVGHKSFNSYSRKPALWPLIKKLDY
jgi:hypothetical protein